MAELLFYVCANRAYEDFAPLFVASSLWSVEGAAVEVGLESVERFADENRSLVDILDKAFGNRVLLRNVAWTRDGEAIKPNTVRFINQPETRAPYVYISDIDIIFLDRTFPAAHLAFMKKVGLPYSNCTRVGTERLSGLHFTTWDALYPLPDVSDLDLRRSNDEIVLRIICARKGLGFHDEWWRPVPGIHVSPNRQPELTVRDTGQIVPGWGAARYWKAYDQFRQSDIFKAIAPLLKGKAREAVQVLEGLKRPAPPPRPSKPAPPAKAAPKQKPPKAPPPFDPEREKRIARRKLIAERRAARMEPKGPS